MLKFGYKLKNLLLAYFWACDVCSDKIDSRVKHVEPIIEQLENIIHFSFTKSKACHRWIPCLHFNSLPLTATDRSVSRLAGKKIVAVYEGDYQKEGKLRTRKNLTMICST